MTPDHLTSSYDPTIPFARNRLPLGLMARMTRLSLGRLGWRATATLLRATLAPGDGASRPVHLRDMKGPLWIRPGTSDIPTLIQIFVLDEYGFTTDLKPRVIVDGGANVGFATLDLARRFPRAEVVAVEPEASNFTQLCRNVAGWPRIRPIRAGLWPRPGWLRIVDTADCDHWGFQVTACDPNAPGAVPALPLDHLDREYDGLDLVKLDVEGAEEVLFPAEGGPPDWLRRVKLLAIEAPGRDRLMTATAAAGLTWVDNPRMAGNDVCLFVRPPYQLKP